MTIPLVHKAACQKLLSVKFFSPNHHLLSVQAAQTFLGAAVTSLVEQRGERSCTFPSRFPAPQPALRAPAPALLSQSCSCSPSASPPLTQTRANMPTVSLATVPEPCDSFFLHSWSNTNHKIQNPHEEVTLVWPSTHLSHLCRSENHCTRKYFTKWFFFPPCG